MTATQTAPKLTRLGPYQLLAELRQGEAGTVHLAKMDAPAGIKKLVVVKELRAELADSSEFRALFSADMRVAMRLKHSNVVHTYGEREAHGRLYFATEYCDGQPWSRIRHALWQRDSLSEALHVKVLTEVLSGLNYAHALRDQDETPLSIVHGHVSPQNVIVTYDGQVKLVDFGVARALLDIGKLAYSAPEQARGDAVDRRADIFAVGILLWEALTRRPFVQSQEASEVRRQRISGSEPRLRAVLPDAPPALADICDRALALAPEDRFATAAELRDALLGYLGEDMRDSDRVRLGELVQGAFQKERAKLHAVIEPHLRPADPPVVRTPPVRSAEPAAPTPRVHAAWTQHVWRRLRRGPLPLLVIGVALLSFSITWLVSRPEPDAVVPAPTRAHRALREPLAPITRERNEGARAQHSEEAVRSSEPRLQRRLQPETSTSLNALTDADRAVLPSTLHLTISARPTSAVLYLDGVTLSDNPFSVSIGADHQRHTIRASGIGLASQERVVTFDRDHTVSLDLAPRVARTPSAALRAARKAQVPSATAPSSASPPTPDAATGGARQRAAMTDMLDAPLRVGKTPRPIYEDDPYPSRR